MPDLDLSDELKAEVVARIRTAARLAPDEGPSDERIIAAVEGFVRSFDFRYIEVIRKALKKYRPLLVGRINPLVRKMQLVGMSASEVAKRLVDDWAARNYVTAGGFAIEELAIGIAVNCSKSGSEGIDIQEYTDTDGYLDYNLYVLKSGPVTRNSDILKSLKTNSKKAEQILRQNKSVRSVTANYAIATGKTSSGFTDGVKRPSSEELWATFTGLDEERAVDLVIAMAEEAGRFVQQETEQMLDALRKLVEAYIESETEAGVVDWEWITNRTMRDKEKWSKEDRDRHKRALGKLEAAAPSTEIADAAADAPETDTDEEFDDELEDPDAAEPSIDES